MIRRPQQPAPPPVPTQQPEQHPYGNDFDPEDVHARYGVVDGVNQDQGYMPGEIAYLDTDTPGSGRAGAPTLARDVFAEHPDEFDTAGDEILSEIAPLWRGGLVFLPTGGLSATYPTQLVVGPNPGRRRFVVVCLLGGINANQFVLLGPSPSLPSGTGFATFTAAGPVMLGNNMAILTLSSPGVVNLEMFHTGPIYANTLGANGGTPVGLSWFEESYQQRPDKQYVG